MRDQTVVVLLSDKRSGSTMFQRELCKHPEIQTVAYSPHTYLETHHWLKGAVLLGMASQTFAGRQVYSGYGSLSSVRTYIVDCVKRNVPAFAVPDDDRELVFDGWEALCEQFAEPVFFEKSPQLIAHWAGLSLLYEWIQRTEFNVKVIGLTRNPLSVQYSAFQTFHTNPVKRQFGWLEIHKNLLAFQQFLQDDHFLHVRYEDIVEQPQATFARICGFVGVPEWSEMGGSTHTESLTKWQDDPLFTMQLDPVVKQMALRFGYSEKELHNPWKPTPPLSYRVSRMRKRVFRQTLSHFRNEVFRPIQLWLHWK